MKILVSLTYYLPYLSGLSVYAQRLTEGLVDRGYQLTVITSRHDKSVLPKEMLNKIEINRVWSPLKFHKGIIMPTWLVASLKAVIRSDLVICHLPQVEGIWVLLWSKLFRRRTISIYHCDVNLPSGRFNKVINKMLMGINHLCLYLSDIVVNSSEDYASNSTVLRHYLNKLKVIYPPIKDYSKTKREKIPSRVFYQTKLKIGFVGRFSADKGIEYLIGTVPLLQKKLGNDFKIFLVGPNKPVGEEKYINKINNLLVSNREQVICLGRLSEGELAEFYQTIDVLVLPSINSTEAFGMVQVEALLNGAPVVTSNLPGIREAIKVTGMGLLVKPQNSQFLAKAILLVLSKMKTYTKGRLLADKFFSISRTTSAFVDIIDSFKIKP